MNISRANLRVCRIFDAEALKAISVSITIVLTFNEKLVNIKHFFLVFGFALWNCFGFFCPH